MQPTHRSPEQESPSDRVDANASASTRSRLSFGPVAVTAGALVVVGAALVLVWSAAITSTARISAATGATGFFSAGTVTLDQPTSSSELLFNADLLYPGLAVTGCVVIDYGGSLPASVRVHSRLLDGTGLEEYLELRLTRLDQPVCPVDASGSMDDAAYLGPDVTELTDPAEGEERTEIGGGMTGSTLFAGRLSQLLAERGSYDNGLVVEAEAKTGERFVLVAEAWLVIDDDAQGLTSDFTLIVEARP